ncbi:MAG: DUF4238 domain-containing protein [Chitinispirillia bacterium]|nr:DUF4238 domain-containing protein [Chitinispirillia bacterium]
MFEKKIRQHYVWKYYLKPWCTDGQIVCQIRSTGNIFKASTNDVAVKKKFYKINELSMEDIEFLKAFSDRLSTCPKRVANDWINLYKSIFDIRNGFVNPEIRKNFDDIFDVFINNIEEDTMCIYENLGEKYLNQLRLGDISFYSDEDSFLDFNFYIVMQYLRTEKMAKSIPDVNAKKSWHVMREILTSTIVWNVFKIGEWEMVKLDNTTEIPFITGDQPVINILNEKDKPQQKMMLYYPITPQIAILIKEKDEKYRNINDLDDVRFYNNKIVQFSENQIYSNTENIKECISQN